MKEYIKLYQKMREDYYQKWGNYSHPENLTDFEKLNQQIFEEHLKKYNDSSNEILKTKLYIDLVLNKIQYFGYYSAFCEGDFKKLNNALWQNGRNDLLRGGMTLSGTSYTGNIIKGIFTCFACNDFEVIQSVIPHTLPLLKGTYYTENVINLLHSIYYKEDERLKAVMGKAESFLTKKKMTGLAEYYVRFFIFLAKKEVDGISECLQKLCESHQKQGYPIQKIDKCFIPEIHGLYHLVRFLDKNLFEQIKLPSHKCFLKELEEWQQKNNFPKGAPFYQYPEPLSDANRILQSPLPLIHLIHVDGKLVIDVEKFVEELSRTKMES